MDQISLLKEATRVNTHSFSSVVFDPAVCWSQSAVILSALIHLAPGIVRLRGRRLRRLPGHGAFNELSSSSVDSHD
jgi:hypothetical protein